MANALADLTAGAQRWGRWRERVTVAGPTLMRNCGDCLYTKKDHKFKVHEYIVPDITFLLFPLHTST